MNFTRVWAMPSADTFDIAPIGDLVKRYLRQSKVSVDPFARNKRWATHTNDLNPDTAAEYHLDALEFLQMLKDKGTQADLIIFDPVYSVRQLSECYESVGREVTMRDTQSATWTDWKAALCDIAAPDYIAISCGWNSGGMGIKNKFDIVEILLVPHGGMHNDTIVTIERKVAHQDGLGI